MRKFLRKIDDRLIAIVFGIENLIRRGFKANKSVVTDRMVTICSYNNGLVN